jgi:hypothetical protein
MRLQQKQPGRPWLWRDDWARGVIAGEARRILARHWLRAIAVSAFYILAIYVGFRHTPGFDLLSEHYPALSSLVLVILVLPPVCALGYAMYVSLRHRKFGASTFLMSVIPCQVGGRLAGSIEIRLQDLPQDGFLVRLSTIRTTGNRKYDKTIWSTEQTVGVERVSRGIGGVTVPVDIAIPDDAAPTGRVDSFSGRVDSFLSHYWRLTITASLPGIDFEAEFRPPVFRLDAEGRVPDDAPG